MSSQVHLSQMNTSLLAGDAHSSQLANLIEDPRL